MSSEWQKLRATPHRLWQLFKTEILPPQAWKRSQEIAGYFPTRAEWQHFVFRLLMASGTIFLIAGIFFFFAFNWDDLPRLARFAIIEGAVIVATILAFILNIDTWGGRIALGAATMLVGATFLVVGQAYQTGADSYSLFMLWAIVISGWVLISRWNILWLIWLILINITISLYWMQVVLINTDILNLILITINFGFVLFWDILTKLNRFEFMKRGRWILYFLMIPALIHATALMINFIFNFGHPYLTLNRMAPLIYIGVMLILILFYTQIRRDLLMLTMICVSILMVAIVGTGKMIYETIFDTISDPVLFYFLMGIITIGFTVALVYSLRQIQKQWGDIL